MNKWIDVNDRLPENDREVLIYSLWQTIDIGWYNNGEWGCENYNCKDGDVVAWMPLPEPYKLPKKKKFTDDELCILRNIKSEINTLGRNINGTIYVTSDYGKSYLKLFNNLFQSLDIGEEIIIDDYVER